MKTARWPFVLHLVPASSEHNPVLASKTFNTIIDVGANRGQFSLAARHFYPEAMIFAFEPLPKPAAVYRRLFGADSRVKFFETAIATARGPISMHVSRKDHSSSVYPFAVQADVFPGTHQIGTADVQSGPLTDFVTEQDLHGRVMLKIDVQGAELEVLKSANTLLDRIDIVYVELSFVEFYRGQSLAHEVIEFLLGRGHVIRGVYNAAYDRRTGLALQADVLFERRDIFCEVGTSVSIG
jgi:FkbM family methyltransferase